MLSTWRRDTGAGRAATVLVAGSAIGLNVVFALLIHSAFPALQFFPQSGQAGAAAVTSPVSVAEVARRTGKTPAEVVVEQILAAPPKLPAGAVPVSALTGTPSSPLDVVCGARSGPGPVVAKGRGWTVASGSQVASFQAGYTVTMSAYGAGQGAVAFTAIQAQVNQHCLNKFGTASIVASEGVGVDAATAWVSRSGSRTTAFLWRRGDVIAMVASTGSTVPMGMVQEYDARIAAALSGVCAVVDSSVSDGARSPYADRAGFTGLTVDRPVGLPAGVTAPSPVQPPAPVAVPVVDLPVPPAAPFWPATLPSAVEVPVAPPVPAYPALTAAVPVRVEDDEGPGCGWSFTGQPVPLFDQAIATSKADEDKGLAQKALAGTMSAYSDGVPGYRTAYALYLADVKAFQTYAQAVTSVADAWDVIRADQTQYADALKLYAAAVKARDAFLVRQVSAKAVYDAAVTACAARKPVPVDTPAPTTSPASTVSPAVSATVPPSVPPTKPAMVCPPVPAPIIAQPSPTAPVSPTSPPDPRPTATR